MRTFTKHTLALIALILISVSFGNCTQKSRSENQPIIKGLLKQENMRSYSIPAFLVKSAMLISKDTRSIRSALNGAKSFTISIYENIEEAAGAYTRINSGLKAGNYSSIIEVIEGDSKMTIKTLEHNGVIKEMVIIINDQSSFVCFSVKGSINPDSILEAVSKFA
ncbi:MAG: DUF4252 domain-containing protein [Bacteroidales bacterium]